MNERQSLEEAVSKLSGRSEMLRAFLDGKIGAWALHIRMRRTGAFFHPMCSARMNGSD
jgi:hypothetical protein